MSSCYNEYCLFLRNKVFNENNINFDIKMFMKSVGFFFIFSVDLN